MRGSLELFYKTKLDGERVELYFLIAKALKEGLTQPEISS